MGVYHRYKVHPNGLRQLVELLESSAPRRRERMIRVGYAEDQSFTRLAMGFMMTLDDVLALSDMELAELLCSCNPRLLAFAIQGLETEPRSRFMKCCPRGLQVEVKLYLESPPRPEEVSAGFRHLLSQARKLERDGVLQVKTIPLNAAS
jgi:flagellar motor switch protein FliG